MYGDPPIAPGSIASQNGKVRQRPARGWAEEHQSLYVSCIPPCAVVPLPETTLQQSLTQLRLRLGVDSTQLPLWRYWPRQKLLPLIRYETPYLAWVQGIVRNPTLDSYFAFTANLGTHTFFMVFLPFLFWCGHTSLGRAYV